MCEICDQDRDYETVADEAVVNGIAWLDLNGPENWRDLINLEWLDIDRLSQCVLGQVFRDKASNPSYTHTSRWSGKPMEFGSGYDYVIHTFFGGLFSDVTTGEYGFSALPGVDGEYMTGAWRRALTA
jgi:hypothetical protein